jgi:adenylosuccinate synthase
MINGVTQLIMMKADVLSDFEELEICTHYLFEGKKIDYLPYDISPDKVQPIYQTVKGWHCDLTQLRKESEFPAELSSYITFIENALEVPITVVSVGPDRMQTIDRKA